MCALCVSACVHARVCVCMCGRCVCVRGVCMRACVFVQMTRMKQRNRVVSL